MKRMLICAGVITLVIILISCLRKELDRPRDFSHYDPMIPVTHSIAALKAMNGFYNYQTGGDTTCIVSDVVVTGIVTADDRSGNFYKQLVVEDSTAAIMVLIDANNIYNDYPVGRKIYIRCKGLYLGYDGGLPVLGVEPGPQLVPGSIPNDRLVMHIIKADVGHERIPTPVDMTQVKAAYENLYNRLITIRDVQFKDAGFNYTQPNGTTNRDLMDCYGNKLVLRTSNFSDFASFPLPVGNGSATGIYTVYISPTTAGKTPQLLIRDTNDIYFRTPRCTATVPVITMISIDSLRNRYSGVQTNLSACRITGIVISDRSAKNVDTKNLVLQNAGAGIVVRFSAVHNFDMGDSLIIDISGSQLGEYNGLLEVGAVNASSSFQTSKASVITTNQNISVSATPIAEILSDPARFESTLVMIKDAVASGGATYVTGSNGNKMLTDVSATLTLYTYPAAVFANAALPVESRKWTGIIGRFGTTVQLQLRNLNDVQ